MSRFADVPHQRSSQPGLKLEPRTAADEGPYAGKAVPDDRAAEVVHHPSRFLRDRLPIGADRAINVLLLLAGMMSLVGVLKDTGVFAWGVARVLRATGGRPYVVLTLLIWLTAALSAAVDNVTTVIFVTPMAIAMARQSGAPPAAFLMPMVMASNIGGTATLVGDPPNIMIASGADIPFVAFLLNVAAPVLLQIIVAAVAYDPENPGTEPVRIPARGDGRVGLHQGVLYEIGRRI